MAKKKKEVELKEVSRTEINGAIIIKYEAAKEEEAIRMAAREADQKDQEQAQKAKSEAEAALEEARRMREEAEALRAKAQEELEKAKKNDPDGRV